MRARLNVLNVLRAAFGPVELLAPMALVMAASAAIAACVDVPDGVRAQFAGPAAAERSNFRPGHHGQAPPVEDPPVAKTAETAVTGATLDASATTPSTPSSESTSDGGAP